MKVLTFRHSWGESLRLGLISAVVVSLVPTFLMYPPPFQSDHQLIAIAAIACTLAILAVRFTLPATFTYGPNGVVMKISGHTTKLKHADVRLVALTGDGKSIYWRLKGGDTRYVRIDYRPELDEYLHFISQGAEELELKVDLSGWERS